ncbi:cilia- and flagella-associated protein 251-like [Glycine soja]|uniref:cilia- and flagella-associated protein 251-like n=1 Tax=Glycine max TaxID=3847 RepID=UPI00023CA949|nr:cilia- and flagella-associated protein 251-like [Glycine max]XP_028181283.1 cilia- and flagella-associated protein 251-like [Glycine soja]|eukprot:XP_006588048.1 cilia- and flagella-associated protein 251-like [Glycine max]
MPNHGEPRGPSSSPQSPPTSSSQSSSTFLFLSSFATVKSLLGHSLPSTTSPCLSSLPRSSPASSSPSPLRSAERSGSGGTPKHPYSGSSAGGQLRLRELREEEEEEEGEEDLECEGEQDQEKEHERQEERESEGEEEPEEELEMEPEGEPRPCPGFAIVVAERKERMKPSDKPKE